MKGSGGSRAEYSSPPCTLQELFVSISVIDHLMGDSPQLKLFGFIINYG